MRIHRLRLVFVLVLAAATLAGCIWVPVPYGYPRPYRHHHGHPHHPGHYGHY